MLYTVKEVANLLKVNKNYVYTAIKKGELEAIKIGSIKITKEALDAFIKSKGE